MKRRFALAAALLLLTGCVSENLYEPAPGQKMRVSQRTFDAFKEYEGLIGSTRPGAFAVSSDGEAYSYRYCEDTYCTDLVAIAQKALGSCYDFGRKCYLFAKNDEIKVDYLIVP